MTPLSKLKNMLDKTFDAAAAEAKYRDEREERGALASDPA